MLLDELANLDMFDIEDKIPNTDGEERLFYVALYNKVLNVRRQKYLVQNNSNEHKLTDSNKLNTHP